MCHKRERLGFRLGYRDRDSFGSVGLVLVLSSWKSIGPGIAWSACISIGRSEASSIGGSLGYLPVGRYLGRLI